MKKWFVLGLSLLQVLVSQAAFARSDSMVECGESHRPMRVTARHIESGGIGYNHGYTTVEGFFSPYNKWDNWILFLDARLHIFNSGKPAVNAGLGTRYLTDKRIWGGNVYYDYRKTRRYHYNQVAFGFESLGAIWDFRANGYVPVGPTMSNGYNAQFWKFEGSSAVLRQKYEFAMAGFNAEAGAHVNAWRHYPLYFAAGPYYLTGHGATTWGGEARASVTIYDYLKLEGYTSYDHVFKWTGQGQIGVNFSFGGKKEVLRSRKEKDSCCDALCVAARWYQPVDRFEIMPVDKKHRYSVAINPLTGDPYSFWFVDNTSHSNGTFESPSNVLGAVDNDVIYVFPGDGTSTGMDTGIVLRDNQRFWGSPVSHFLPTTVGTVTVPSMSSGLLGTTVVLPMITNSTGDVITLASGNEISGFYVEMENVVSNGITGSGISNLTVLHCTLAGDDRAGYNAGITISDLTGTLTVSDCTFNQVANGINLINSDNSLAVNISNNDFSGGSTGPLINWVLDGARGTLSLQNNTFLAAGAAIVVAPSASSTINAQIGNNQITATTYGFYIDGDATGTATVSMSANTVTAYSDQTVYFSEPGVLAATVTNNTFTSSDDYAMEIDLATGSDGSSLFLSGNQLTAYSTALYIDQTGGTLSATLNNNSLVSTEDSDYGLYIESSGSSIATLVLNGNSLTGEYGMYVAPSGEATVSATLNNNTLIGIDDYGMYIDWTSSSIGTFILNGNSLTGDYGMYVSQDGGTLSATLNNNNIFGSGDYGMGFESSGTSIATAVLNGNSLAGDYGMYVSTSDAATVSATLNNNTLIGLDDYAMYIDSAGTSIATAVLNGNTLTGYYGMYVFQDQTGGNTAVTMNHNSVATEYGVYWDTTAGVTEALQMTGNKLNCGEAIYVTQTAGAGDMSIVANDNVVNSGELLYFPVASSGDTTVSLSGNTCYGYDPVYITQDNGSLTATVTNNTLVAADTSGFSYVATGGTSSMTISGNTIRSTGPDGAIYLTSSSADAVGATISNNNLSGLNYACYAISAAGTDTISLLNNTVTSGGGFNLRVEDAATAIWNVNGNSFAIPSSTPVAATAYYATACMQLNNNVAYPLADAYVLDNIGSGTFTLNPPQGNTGQVVTTDVTIGVCP